MTVRATRLQALLLPGALLLTSGCVGDQPADVGECDGFVGLGGAVYEIHNETADRVPVGTWVGRGDSLDCDRRAVGSVGVYRIEGVRTQVAVAVPDSSEPGRYVVWVAEGTDPAEWPDEIRPGS